LPPFDDGIRRDGRCWCGARGGWRPGGTAHRQNREGFNRRSGNGSRGRAGKSRAGNQAQSNQARKRNKTPSAWRASF